MKRRSGGEESERKTPDTFREWGDECAEWVESTVSFLASGELIVFSRWYEYMIMIIVYTKRFEKAQYEVAKR